MTHFSKSCAHIVLKFKIFRRKAISEMLKTAELADGLLGTTLQWEDVQKIAEESAGHNLKIGEKKTIKPLAEGVVSFFWWKIGIRKNFKTQGLQSLLGIAEIDWEVEGDDKAPYPNKFALKIGSPVALLRKSNHIP